MSVEGVGELNPSTAGDRKFGSTDPRNRHWTIGSIIPEASEEAESIARMRIEAHREHGKVLCSLMLGDRQVSFSDPRTLVQYIAGIKLALEMMMRGEITCERGGEGMSGRTPITPWSAGQDGAGEPLAAAPAVQAAAAADRRRVDGQQHVPGIAFRRPGRGARRHAERREEPAG